MWTLTVELQCIVYTISRIVYSYKYSTATKWDQFVNSIYKSTSTPISVPNYDGALELCSQGYLLCEMPETRATKEKCG